MRKKLPFGNEVHVIAIIIINILIFALYYKVISTRLTQKLKTLSTIAQGDVEGKQLIPRL